LLREVPDPVVKEMLLEAIEGDLRDLGINIGIE